MKRFLNILRCVFWLLVIIPPMLFWAMVIGYVFDEAGDCAENGKVWDYNEKRCRDDCLTWNEVNGCIYRFLVLVYSRNIYWNFVYFRIIFVDIKG